MSDSVVGIGWDLLKSYVVVPMERGFGYVISSKRFANRLGQEVLKLENEVERVGALEEQARNNVREFHVVFLRWKGSADQALAEARQLLDVFEKDPKTCCYGTLPDPKSRYRFSREAEDKIEIIKQLTQNCIRFRALDDICFINSASRNVAALTLAGIEGKDVVQPTAATASTSSASTSTNLGDDGVFESRALITQDIMDALANNSNSVVGVYGMGGVGKSTLLVDVESRIRKEKLFLVAKADVSENPDIKTIQGEIADALGLTDIQNRETIRGRRELLHRRLTEGEGKNKILIILDDLWKRLDLKSVGIPCGHDNKVIGCKLLLTSRDQNVLRIEMGCDKDFPLGELNEKEAKRLFEGLVGDKVYNDDFKPLVDEALHRCAAILGELKRLEILSLVNSNFHQLPKEIGQLVELRLLDLNHCSKLKIIEPGVLQSLVKLEELYMKNSFDQWNLVEQTTTTNAGLIELNLMKNLRTMHMYIPNPSMLPEDLNVGKLSKYEILIGRCWQFRSEYKGSTILKLKLDPLSNVLRKGCIQSILGKTDHLFLDGLDGIERSICALSRRGFPNLRHLQVMNSPSIHYIHQSPSHIDFETLESLILEDLINLEKLHHNHISSKSFSALKVIRVRRCHKMKVLFPLSLLRGLPQLEEIEVDFCKLMRGIVDADDGGRVELHNLHVLKLWNLPDIKSFFTVGTAPLSGTLDDQVGTQIAFFNRQQVVFSRLETLEIDGLDNVEILFFPSMIKSLTQLRYLDISNCKKMEAIIMEEEGMGLDLSETLAFPMLTELNLNNLESLMCFSHRKRSQETQSQDCIKSCPTTLFNQEVAFPNLENLYIKDMGNIKMIWHDQIPADSFSKLKLLSINECKKLVNVIPSFILGRLLSLETLTVKACDSLEVVFKLQPLNPLDGNSVARSPLKELKLDDLSMLNCVWDKELYHHIKFQCLRSITLWRCARLASLFSASIARDLIQLEELEINQCGIVELIEKEGPDELSINVEDIEGPSHELKVTSSFPSYFQHMKTLDVSYCHGLSNMFTPTMATNLVELTKLRISKCEILTEVISDEGGKEGHVMAFNQLKYMELDGLTRLRCFSSGGYTLIFPLLEDIIVNTCSKMKFFHEGRIETPKLVGVKVGLNEGYGATECEYFLKGNLNTTIQSMLAEMVTFAGIKFMWLYEFPELIGKWHGELNPVTSYWQLKTLVVNKCPSFINAIPSSLMFVLERMISLQVCDCEALEEIFDLEGLKDVNCTQVLPELRYLYLVNLPKLRQLWNKDLQGMMCFNSLWKLNLYKCSNLRHAFVPSMARCLPNLLWMEIKECDQMEGVIADEEGQGRAMEEITFPNLWQITLECLPYLTSFLLWKNHRLECPILSKLSIVHCPEMRSLTWQSSMEIDNGTPSLFTPQVQCPKLEQMFLSHMDNLSKIWSDGPQETLTFDNLRKVQVQNCRSLKNVFPCWVATSLTQLKELQVESCGIEEIVASGNETPHSNTTQDFFPKLTSLVLRDMPQLKNFCTNLPTLNWSFLKELRVTHCDKVNMLSFVASMSNGAQKDDQQGLLDQEAHSLYERDFPSLERLLLVDNNIQMIQDGNFPEDIFGKPKALTLACFHDENAIFPLKFLLEKFQDLQSLEVFCSSFKDIFLDEGLVDNGKHPVLESLEELKLNKLHNLKSVWREGSSVLKILQSIKTFEIWDCPCLTTIFPTMTSFKNLTTLVVKNSSGLIHLVTASMVTNLVHLNRMTIIGCERMKEIVTNDGNGEGKVISFGNLNKLTLQNLPNLECFSSIPSCIFRFPYLWNIEVEECPKMKTFSEGMLSTPWLQLVTLFRYKWEGGNWEEGGDLNTTIQKLSA